MQQTGILFTVGQGQKGLKSSLTAFFSTYLSLRAVNVVFLNIVTFKIHLVTRTSHTYIDSSLKRGERRLALETMGT